MQVHYGKKQYLIWRLLIDGGIRETVPLGTFLHFGLLINVAQAPCHSAVGDDVEVSL